jgi:xanthine/CO dehydrogenase XdhC/CoxF family maturation factor
LVIIGAGNDVLPLMHFADILGWETKIVDGRANYARPERFATACQVLVSKPEKVLEQIAIDPWTAFALMTHNFIYDKAMLRELCQKEAKYIGMLGPKKKLDRMLEELANEGINIDSEQQKAIYGPIGLDIGAETPEEIALSIIAEIKAVFEGRNGSFLRTKTGAIHAALTHE